MRGRELDEAAARTLKDAVQLYTADLLESWYQEWCLCERQRLQDMYHTMLDKLMDYCEAHLDYETGVLYGTRILRLDPAQERTHRRLMRLHYLGGDRTAALRQYQLCERALRENLNVKPAQRTVALYEQIRADQLEHLAPTPLDEGASKTVPQPAEIVADLKHYGTILADLQRRIYMDIQALEDLLGSQH
jgi:DNA-binding SARP family transcriptional activator